jgi:hypothetical protein
VKSSAVIPPLDAEVIWKQMVDVADDCFTVATKQRVTFANGVPTEGRIDAFPQTGATSELRAIDLDAPPRVSVALPVYERPQERPPKLQKLSKKLPLHSVNPLPGIRRLLHVAADFFEPSLGVEKSSFL